MEKLVLTSGKTNKQKTLRFLHLDSNIPQWGWPPSGTESGPVGVGSLLGKRKFVILAGRPCAVIKPRGSAFGLQAWLLGFEGQLYRQLPLWPPHCPLAWRLAFVCKMGVVIVPPPKIVMSVEIVNIWEMLKNGAWLSIGTVLSLTVTSIIPPSFSSSGMKEA